MESNCFPLDLTEAVAAIERCIKDIRKWMLKNKLMTNDNKTQFIIIGTRQQLMKVNISHITIDNNIGDSEIVPLPPVKNLGAWFDETLPVNCHITKATTVAFYYLYNLRHIRKYLTKITTEILIHAFISSRFDYCNSLLYGLPAIQLNKLH